MGLPLCKRLQSLRQLMSFFQSGFTEQIGQEVASFLTGFYAINLDKFLVSNPTVLIAIAFPVTWQFWEVFEQWYIDIWIHLERELIVIYDYRELQIFIHIFTFIFGTHRVSRGRTEKHQRLGVQLSMRLAPIGIMGGKFSAIPNSLWTSQHHA